jgi:hypothetical protein
VFQGIGNQWIWIGNGMEIPRVEPLHNEVGFQAIVTRVREDIVDMLNERSSPLPNALPKVIQIACAINAIH